MTAFEPAIGINGVDVVSVDACRPIAGCLEECVANPSEMPGAAAVAPLTLSDYQEGAVVSRILLKRSGGTVTLFAFDEGQSLSEHTAPFDAVAHVLEGEALITVAGTPLTVPAGAMVLLPANQPHAVAAPQRFKMLLTMIRSV
jgi:quercetin dioxygenase-like cupin family protein